jgi:hypothetical protein
MIVTVLVLSAVACAWLKDMSPGIAAGNYWLQSILCEFHHSVGKSKNTLTGQTVNLVSSLMFGGIAWTLWRPRDE